MGFHGARVYNVAMARAEAFRVALCAHFRLMVGVHLKAPCIERVVSGQSSKPRVVSDSRQAEQTFGRNPESTLHPARPVSAVKGCVPNFPLAPS
jgi:hypothetical protein